MTPRSILLRAEHMAHLLDHPALSVVTDDELQVLELFMRFCAEHGLTEPGYVDVDAFTVLSVVSSRKVELLARALNQFGAGSALQDALQKARLKIEHQANFKGVTKGRNRAYSRSVSVGVDGLPDAWQETLQTLHQECVFASETHKRMQNRLGMFVWSSAQAGLTPDLGSRPAQQALYNDIRARSAARNDGVPRWSYLRSTWEEMRRFASAHGSSDDVVMALGNTYTELTRLEAAQEPLKFSKIVDAGTTTSLLAEAVEVLAQAQLASSPAKRWNLRNRAAAIAIGCAVPARPGDVVEHHVFGAGLFYDQAQGVYRFKYVPQKTEHQIYEPLEISLTPPWNQFIDALILQDQDPRYLVNLREKAFADQRPLYVNYGGTPCVYAWYSGAWCAVAGTGGHIARTLLYDEFSDMGPFGLEYAAASNHHISEKIKAKYRSSASIRKSYAQAHNTMVERYANADDISDLI
ncbi:hypothetical protein [Falsihalocynthiibacter arcticus]|uniref:Uncharacterized protein n=1 Tax=Falsihalocynthiibacter arcticus TaxID=1579316 RepID=A0A126V4D1_9RHOB|nr:hypothetical protein [Falsihalocynthiibacter arcticus]AML52815.1 hypothetical protein RC74_17515 [Falsihalocynthiibacter arcticus]